MVVNIKLLRKLTRNVLFMFTVFRHLSFTHIHKHCSKSKTKTMAAENYRIPAKDSFE